METGKKAMQDSRNNSRVDSCIDCRFVYKNVPYEAVVVDLSQKGAKISSLFLPPTGAPISIALNSKHLKKELMLYGEVVRGSREMTDHGLLAER